MHAFMNCDAGPAELVGCTSTSAQEPWAYTASSKETHLDPADASSYLEATGL